MGITKSSLTSGDCCLLFALFSMTNILFSIGMRAYAAVSLMFILAYLYYYASSSLFRKMAFTFPMKIWLTLTIFHWINAMVKHVPGVNIFDLLHGFKIYACMVIVCFFVSLDLKKTLKTLIATFIFVLCIFIFQSGTNLRSEDTTTWATQIGQMAAILGTFIIYYSTIKNRGLMSTILWLLIPLAFVVMSQTRNGLGMMAIMLVGYLYVYVFKMGGSKMRRLVVTFSLVFVFLVVAIVAVSSSGMSERIDDTNYYQESSFYQREAGGAAGTILDKITRDRLIYYVRGWDFFVNNPLTGIGMWNYENLTGGIFPLHSEYMVHLCEGGLVGITLWLVFVIYIIWGLFRLKNDDKMKYLSLASIAMLLFCGIYAREFYYEMFYPIYGIALYLIYKNQGKILIQESK